jgi:hypothetical protein
MSRLKLFPSLWLYWYAKGTESRPLSSPLDIPVGSIYSSLSREASWALEQDGDKLMTLCP